MSPTLKPVVETTVSSAGVVATLAPAPLLVVVSVVVPILEMRLAVPVAVVTHGSAPAGAGHEAHDLRVLVRERVQPRELRGGIADRPDAERTDRAPVWPSRRSHRPGPRPPKVLGNPRPLDFRCLGCRESRQIALPGFRLAECQSISSSLTELTIDD